MNQIKIQKDTKTIILAVMVVLVIAIVALNFGTTGKAVSTDKQSVTKVYVSSDPEFIEDNPRIKAGSKVYIIVETGSEGTEARAKVYDLIDKHSLRKATTLLEENCGGTTCRPNKVTSGSYATSTSWEAGDYFVAVRDKLTNADVEARFRLY